MTRPACSCPLCGEKFTDPVSLSCGHSFCSPCAEAMLVSSEAPACLLCHAQVQPTATRNRLLAALARAQEAAPPSPRP